MVSKEVESKTMNVQFETYGHMEACIVVKIEVESLKVDHMSNYLLGTRETMTWQRNVHNDNKNNVLPLCVKFPLL